MEDRGSKDVFHAILHPRSSILDPRLSILFCTLVFLMPAGCTSNRNNTTSPAPLIRVRLLSTVDQVLVTASQPPIIRASSDSAAHVMQFPNNQPVQILLGTDGVWRIGNVPAGSGELILQPATDGSLLVNGQAYHGVYRLVPSQGSTKFDLINDLDLDSYLKGVLSVEIPSKWQEETYKAQAITSRTYALYQIKTQGLNRSWDVYPDTRSQVYGGIGAETTKSRAAADDTAGVVLAYGAPGEEHIFEAYFSACCGGISQSAYDALGGPAIEPLSDQNVGALCNACPKFNWGPIVIPKDELTRRIRTWGARKDDPIKNMAPISRIDIQYVNRFGRPIRFLLTDMRGTSFTLSSEQTRMACDTDAGDGPTLPSSFFKPVSQADSIAFVEGHGFGHGVGLCQWCAEARSEQGMTAEQILAAAFPRSKLKKAY